MTFNTIGGSLVIAASVLWCAGVGLAQNENPAAWTPGSYSAPFAGYFGYQPGMMGGPSAGPGSAGDQGQISSMPTPPSIPSPFGIPITSNKALDIVEKYLQKTNNGDLYPARFFEYNTHFEIELKEKETQRGAFELIIDKFNGSICPETGPNLLWNTKYGLNGNYFGIQPAATISVGDALQRVGVMVKNISPELLVQGDVTDYYGLYEFHVTQDGKLALEVNVNAFTGQIWIENWHGSLLRESVVRTK